MPLHSCFTNESIQPVVSVISYNYFGLYHGRMCSFKNYKNEEYKFKLKRILRLKQTLLHECLESYVRHARNVYLAVH